MLIGRMAPELGRQQRISRYRRCKSSYSDNQWYLHGSTIPLGHHSYRPLAEMLREVYERYDRPLLISETGAEGRVKHYWLHHVCGEVSVALARGIPVEGVCLYPVVDYHGWDNGRVCDVGLMSLPDDSR